MNPQLADIPMDPFDAELAGLIGSDDEAKARLLGDLGESLTRHADLGSGGRYWFSSRAIADLPRRLDPGMIERIARAVEPVLLDVGAAEGVRVTAAFVLGKAYHPRSLSAIARAVGSPATLPAAVGRQCGFAWDTLWRELAPGDPPVDLDAVAAGFRALGVPWDDRTRTVVADDL